MHRGHVFCVRGAKTSVHPGHHFQKSVLNHLCFPLTKGKKLVKAPNKRNPEGFFGPYNDGETDRLDEAMTQSAKRFYDNAGSHFLENLI